MRNWGWDPGTRNKHVWRQQSMCRTVGGHGCCWPRPVASGVAIKSGLKIIYKGDWIAYYLVWLTWLHWLCISVTTIHLIVQNATLWEWKDVPLAWTAGINWFPEQTRTCTHPIPKSTHHKTHLCLLKWILFLNSIWTISLYISKHQNYYSKQCLSRLLPCMCRITSKSEHFGYKSLLISYSASLMWK